MDDLYITDMDGTLLNSNGQLSAPSYNYLKLLLSKSFPFTIASGRSPLSVCSIFKNLNFVIPMILLNGAIIYDFQNNKAVTSTPIPHTSRQLLDDLRQSFNLPEFQILSSASGNVISLFSSPEHWEPFWKHYRIPFQNNDPAPPSSLIYTIFMDHHPEQLEYIYNTLQKTDLFSLDFYKDTYLPETWFLEIYDKHASKGQALKTLKELYNFENITCFGNGENDLSLFSESTWCCAVDNAKSSLKDHASQIIPDCDHNGVAEYLFQVYLTENLWKTLQSSPSIVQLTSTLMAYFSLKPVNSTFLPDFLKTHTCHTPHKNLIYILADGLGSNILTKHLPKNSFFNTHFKTNLVSVFPPPTVSAAPALETGLYPSQSGYLGWSIYWPYLKQNIAVFTNLTDDGIPASHENIAKQYLYHPDWINELNNSNINTIEIDISYPFTDDLIAQSVEKICKFTNSPGEHILYLYLNEPDHTLHKKGTQSPDVTSLLIDIEKMMLQLSKMCADTLFVFTADHGFIDVDPLCLEDYPELMNMLQVPPSLEPRAMNLFIKPEYLEKFCSLFHKITKNTYHLYSKQEVLKNALFGPPPVHPLLEEMLGDYLAVAQTPLTLFPNRSYLDSMVATHGGLTTDELLVPLIIFESEC